MKSIIIYYDDKCPICKDYISYLRLEKDFEKVQIIGMRTLNEKELNKLSYESNADLNRGILVKIYDDKGYSYLSREKAAAFIGKYSNNKVYKYISQLLELKLVGIAVYTMIYLLRRILLKIKKINVNIYK